MSRTPTKKTKVRRVTVIEQDDGSFLKVCTVCLQPKQLTDFVVNSYGTLGRNSLCRPCERVRRTEQYQKNIVHRRTMSRENARRYYKANPEKFRLSSRKWSKENPEKASLSRRKANLKRLYGLTLEQFDSMLQSQGGSCAICKRMEPNGIGWQVDHCHATRPSSRHPLSFL